jgi:predicted membrane-bound dolichyl-phosphate-mannose-protein mannosyltransferase
MRAFSVARRVRFAAVAAGLAAMLTLTPGPAQSAAARLRHLTGVDELKTWFNAGNGHPRLIFLLSPT